MASDHAERQRHFNHLSSDSWSVFVRHRAHVTALLAKGGPGRKLCVLGAGNLNDLELTGLLPGYREITLVDIDQESVARGLERQAGPACDLVKVRAPFDFSGIDELVAVFEKPDFDAASFARGLAGQLGLGAYDVVCSSCVLSQLIDQVRLRLESEMQRCIELIKVVRQVHLHLLLALLRPGGRALLVSDMVASDTVPGLARIPGPELQELMVKLVVAKNFFTGLNPFVIETTLREDESITPLVSRGTFHPPWLWQLNETRSYLTFAFSFQRQ